MLELLSPAGSREAVTAAVQSGAGAVYLGFGDYNARRNAKNFTPEQFAETVEYCHVRGVKVYLTLNTLLSDAELPGAAEQVRFASDAGADAVLVLDCYADVAEHASPLTLAGGGSAAAFSQADMPKAGERVRCFDLGGTTFVLPG